MPRPTSRLRSTLIASFGTLILLIAVTGIAALAALDGIQRQDARIRAQILESSRALERVRSAVFLSGIIARDYFVAPRAAGAEQLAEQLASVRTDAIRAVDESTRRVSPRLASLRGEIEAYWKVLDLMTGMAREGKANGADQFFRSQLQQRRDAMTEIAAALGRAEEAEARARAQALDRRRRQIRMIAAGLLLAALAGGVAFACVVIRRIVDLETESAGFAQRVVKAQEEERKAIARELHDGVGQSLSALLLGAGPAVRRTGEQALESVRNIALSLRPSMLDDLGLASALEWQAREAARKTGIAVEVETRGNFRRLPEETRTCVYRVAQEALTNACRHSGARRIKLDAECARGRVALCVEDDGRGFDPARQRGLGMLGMEERARLAGGILRFESQPQRGTRVLLDLPENEA